MRRFSRQYTQQELAILDLAAMHFDTEDMRYRRVVIQSLSYRLPEEVLTSAELERRLAPVYERLRLPEGRLELMTGIRERRFWPPGMLPSVKSIESGEQAIAASGIDRSLIGALVHGSVSRDFVEPATAAGVHHALGLPEECVVYDVSNACLGMLSGVLHVANMIELGQIRAGLVVGTESGRQLVENTIEWLNRSEQLSRNDIKLAVASLTIGSASGGMLLVDQELARGGYRLVAAAVRAHTSHHELCHGGDQQATDAPLLMSTDSEALLHAGVAAGVATFEGLLKSTGWTRPEIARTFCHQVGSAHRKLMLESLGLPLDRDFPTFDFLGNTGAAALPVAMALGLEKQPLQAGEKAALLGIGSGINCVMLGIEAV